MYLIDNLILIYNITSPVVILPSVFTTGNHHPSAVAPEITAWHSIHSEDSISCPSQELNSSSGVPEFRIEN